jgi:hypothetical protein
MQNDPSSTLLELLVLTALAIGIVLVFRKIAEPLLRRPS